MNEFSARFCKSNTFVNHEHYEYAVLYLVSLTFWNHEPFVQLVLSVLEMMDLVCIDDFK